MRKFLMLLLCCQLIACGGGGQGDTRESKLDEVIPRVLAQTHVPGVIVGIWQGKDRIYLRAFGVKDIQTREPMTTDLYMRIGSATKAFTVTGILQLVDQGKLSLDDPISKFVPKVPNGDNIKIRHLAQMRSGLASYSDGDKILPLWYDDIYRQFSTQQLLDGSFTQEKPILFEPGAKYDYSNTNTVLLGVVLEQLSGQSLRDYIHDRIAVPVGLTHTEYPTANGGGPIPAPFAHGYALIKGARTDMTFANFSWGNAAGCMVATVEDLGIWARDMARGTLLKPATQAERLKFLDALPEHDGYGLGIENNNGWLGHGGNIFSHVSYPHYLPSEDLTMVVLFNSGENIYESVRIVQEITRIIAPDNVWPDLPEAGAR
jgi:D-alanyl-D-alanine carboxypeptidase